MWWWLKETPAWTLCRSLLYQPSGAEKTALLQHQCFGPQKTTWPWDGTTQLYTAAAERIWAWTWHPYPPLTWSHPLSLNLFLQATLLFWKLTHSLHCLPVTYNPAGSSTSPLHEQVPDSCYPPSTDAPDSLSLSLSLSLHYSSQPSTPKIKSTCIPLPLGLYPCSPAIACYI